MKTCEQCGKSFVCKKSRVGRFCSHKCQMVKANQEKYGDFKSYFWRWVDTSDGPDECWPWLGVIGSNGYGRIIIEKKHQLAHRVSFEMSVGKIPEGLVIDHLCRNTECVNPSHLEAVTLKVNILRGVSMAAQNARKTHCKRGHPLNGANLYIYPHGKRYCRACARQRYAEQETGR